jgi:hypothetical protein
MRLFLRKQFFIRLVLIVGFIYVVYLIFRSNDSSDNKARQDVEKNLEKPYPDPVPNKIQIEKKKEDVDKLNKAYDDLEV